MNNLCEQSGPFARATRNDDSSTKKVEDMKCSERREEFGKQSSKEEDRA